MILLEESDNTTVNALKESLIKPPALSNPSDQSPLFFLVYEKKENALGILIINTGPIINLQVMNIIVNNVNCSCNWNLVLGHYCYWHLG